MTDAAVAVTTRATRTSPVLMSPRLMPLILGLLFVLACRLLAAAWYPVPPGDFELLYASAANLLRGETPYPTGAGWLPYPLPAVLLLAPFTTIGLELARLVFDVLVGWTFVYALWKYRGSYALLAVVSGAYLFALLHGQTTPLMVAASLIPALGFLLAVRPTTSAALWVARPSWIALASVAAFVALSMVVRPAWPTDWWMTFPEDYSAWLPPILRPFGALLLLGALRWSCPEGRLMLAMALLPQTALPYELIALALIPANPKEMAVYLAGTWIAVADAVGVLKLGAVGAWSLSGWPVMLCAVYIPMLVLVLRRPGCKGGPWIGKERRRPHRLPDDELEIDAKVDDHGRVVVTVTHLPSKLSMTQSGPTREAATRKAHDKLAALLARTNRLVRTEAPN